MTDKRKELLAILKNVEQQLTRSQEILKSDVKLNQEISYDTYTYCSYLYWAIYHNTNEKIIEYLIENGANVNDEHYWPPDNVYYTPLTFAIVNKDIRERVLHTLVSNGANVNQVLSNGDTPLTVAAYFEKTSIAEYLLQHGADPNLIGHKGKTPLSWAVIKRNVKIVELLIANGAIINKANTDGKTPIMLAKRNEDMLRLLNDAGNIEANTLKALKEAILKKSLDEVKLIITNGTNVDAVDSEGITPLQHAIKSGDLEIVEYLITSEANVCKATRNGTTPLLLAVQKGNLDVIKLLLDNGADETIQSAFSEAIILKNVEVVRLLTQHGVFLDATYNNGHTSLTKAIEIGNLDIVKILVENGADVNMPKSDATTPLTLSLQNGNVDIVKYLINNEAMFQDEDFGLLMKYIEIKKIEMVQLLVESGVKLNASYQDKDTMETPLVKAVKSENFKIVKYLVEKGADVNQVGSNGKVPLAVAASLKDIRIVKFLIRSNAHPDLAKEELEEYANLDDDIAVYLQILKKKNSGVEIRKQSSEDVGQEAAE